MALLGGFSNADIKHDDLTTQFDKHMSEPVDPGQDETVGTDSFLLDATF